MLYAFFWVIPRRLNFINRRFGTLLLFHLNRQVGMKYTYLPMKIEQTLCSDTWVYKIQTPGDYPEQSIQHSIMYFLTGRHSSLSQDTHFFPWSPSESRKDMQIGTAQIQIYISMLLYNRSEWFRVPNWHARLRFATFLVQTWGCPSISVFPL
jgi:hypothetical protein